jgi:DNA-directed RNA polymerase specialized sigma24 family protein
MSLKDTDETFLIDRAKQGDGEAFNELYARHEKKVYGFIRARANSDTDVREIAQQTRLEVQRRMSTYDPAPDPARRSFYAFAKFWARILLLRYYQDKGKLREREVLFSELVARFPDLEGEIEGVLARLAPYSGSSVEDEAIRSEEEKNLSEVYEELLCLTFNSPSPPHQLIAFGFTKLLEWKPREIVARLSDLPLRELEEKLERDYLEKSQLPEDRILPCFRQLRESLDRMLREVVKERKTLDTYPRLLDRIVGETTLRAYYTGETDEAHAADIPKWWYVVKRRVWSEVQGLAQGPLFDLLQEKE